MPDPGDRCPILVTDAGFRTPWFRAVSAMGWLWLGRLRHRTRVKPVAQPDTPDQWLPCKVLYELVSAAPRDLGLMQVAVSQTWTCRVILHGKPPRHRKDRNRDGQPARSKRSRQNARREREPWLLVVAPELADLNARQLVALYGKRMQIESSFRDLKSHRYGQGFEDSLTRKGPRIAILVLLHALAAFASWIAGLACEAAGLADRLTPYRSHRRLYSIVRVGREALVRHWPCGTLTSLLDRLRNPSAELIAQMGVPA